MLKWLGSPEVHFAHDVLADVDMRFDCGLSAVVVVVDSLVMGFDLGVINVLDGMVMALCLDVVSVMDSVKMAPSGEKGTEFFVHKVCLVSNSHSMNLHFVSNYSMSFVRLVLLNSDLHLKGSDNGDVGCASVLLGGNFSDMGGLFLESYGMVVPFNGSLHLVVADSCDASSTDVLMNSSSGSVRRVLEVLVGGVLAGFHGGFNFHSLDVASMGCNVLHMGSDMMLVPDFLGRMSLVHFALSSKFLVDEMSSLLRALHVV